MKPKVSVIVPIYNTEKYLNKCIDSILNQTLEEIEIILINDGSKDNSSEICSEYKKKYPNKIKYINNKNLGCSATRNLGIQIASGNYVGFVDSDDYIEKDMYKAMYQEAKEKSLDLVISGIRYIKNNKIIKSKIPYKDIKNYEILDEKNLVMLVVNKLFKKSLIEEYKVEFLENSHYQEDLAFSFIYSLHIRRFGSLPKIFYNYRLHSSNSVYNIEKRLDVFTSYRFLYNYILRNKNDKKILHYFYKLYNLYLIGGSFLLLSDIEKVGVEDYKKYKKFFFIRALKEIKTPLFSKLYLMFWYIFSFVLRNVNIKEYLLIIRRKVRKEM